MGGPRKSARTARKLQGSVVVERADEPAVKEAEGPKRGHRRQRKTSENAIGATDQAKPEVGAAEVQGSGNPEPVHLSPRAQVKGTEERVQM